MKSYKFIIALVLGGLLMGGLPASAQTTASSNAQLQVLIQTLQAQIATLKAKVEAAAQARTDVSQTATQIQATAQAAAMLIAQLDKGASGENVTLLQILLAADPALYPEGRVTGFYGNLTAQAVMRFQEWHGLPKVGRVGPRTLEKLREALEKNPIGREDRNGRKEFCAIVPPGHLIAPGWLRLNNGIRPTVPPCQTLPPGIEAKLRATSSIDVTAPVISQLQVMAGSITSASARIAWNTNELANSKVWYSTTSGFALGGNTSFVASANLTMNHDLALSGLAANTTYYYVVVSADASGNVSTSGQGSFTTSAQTDITGPIFYEVMASNVASTTAHITWVTSEMADSKVWFSTTPGFALGGNTMFVASANLVLNHDLTLSGLAANTTYYYAVVSADAAGNVSTSGQASFTTQLL